MKIDSHQHFWIYDPIKDGWIPDSMALIRRDFLPGEVLPAMTKNCIDGSVLVQADQSEAETHFLLELANSNDFIKGVVGWVDLRNKNIAERLNYFSRFPKLKGFRHIVQSEKQVDFLLTPDFCRGIALLKEYDFTYDILIYPRHLPSALEFVKRFPEQRFVIDHLAKPEIRFQLMEEWRKNIRLFAGYHNVSCKLAGLVTEADQHRWHNDQFRPYIATIFDVFGPDRVLFGSDWPVCLAAATYDQVCDIIDDNTSFLDAGDREKLWGLNCTRFYKL